MNQILQFGELKTPVKRQSAHVRVVDRQFARTRWLLAERGALAEFDCLFIAAKQVFDGLGDES